MVCSLLSASLFAFFSAEMGIDELQELVIHSFRFFFFSAPQCFRGAMLQMVAHQIPRDPSQRLLHRGDLGDDVGAIAILFDHLLESADLALDPA